MKKTLEKDLINKFPTISLLRNAANSIFDSELLSQLPGDPIEPIVLANRIIDLAYGYDLEYELFNFINRKKIEPRQNEERVYLGSKFSFFSEACKQLEYSQSLRVTFVGPVFLLPDWIVKRRNIDKHNPNFSIASKMFFENINEYNKYYVRIILRNSPAFIADYGRLVDINEQVKFIDDLLNESYKLWGEQGEKGPQLCCIDPGYFHLPHIFDNTVLIATRSTETSQVDGGYMSKNIEEIIRERDRFDKIFDAANQSQFEALLRLKKFIKELYG